jgi:hypothetical protein
VQLGGAPPFKTAVTQQVGVSPLQSDGDEQPAGGGAPLSAEAAPHWEVHESSRQAPKASNAGSLAQGDCPEFDRQPRHVASSSQASSCAQQELLMQASHAALPVPRLHVGGAPPSSPSGSHWLVAVQLAPAGQPPHWSVAPQASVTCPHSAPADAHVPPVQPGIPQTLG